MVVWPKWRQRRCEQADEPRQAGAEERAAGPLAEAISIMARLRAPGGCPWDREQTFDTIKRYTLEETYEVFDAIERRAWPELKDELGDLLLQVLFYAQMASEAGHFDIADVAANLNAKLVRRHPHVFPVEGKLADATDPEAVLRNWEQIKRGEKLAAAAGKKTASVRRRPWMRFRAPCRRRWRRASWVRRRRRRASTGRMWRGSSRSCRKRLRN